MSDTTTALWLAGYHQALEDAAAECERHAKFCHDEAHSVLKGLMIARVAEATFLAERIRKMKDRGL
jgi:hypothetical protein